MNLKKIIAFVFIVLLHKFILGSVFAQSTGENVSVNIDQKTITEFCSKLDSNNKIIPVRKCSPIECVGNPSGVQYTNDLNYLVNNNSAFSGWYLKYKEKHGDLSFSDWKTTCEAQLTMKQKCNLSSIKIDGRFGKGSIDSLISCAQSISQTTPPAVAACVDPSNNSDEIIIDLPSSATDTTPKPDWIKSETLWNKIKSWLKNGKKRDDMKGYVKSKYESDKINNKQCNICGGTETSKTLDAVEACLDEKKCEEKDGKQLCTPPDKVDGGSESSFGACKPVSGECNCGIKLNTNVPFIGNCISYSSDGSAGGDGLVVTIANAFPALMGGLSKIVVTLILITSFVTLVIAGVSISTGDAIGVGKGMDLIWKVVTGIALLGASGVILHLINPNFFT